MDPSNQNLFLALDAAGRSEAPLLTTPDGTRFTYGDMRQATARYANLLLSLGLRPGDRLTAQVPKTPAAVWLYLASLRAGLVFHPLNEAYQKEELEYLVTDARPSLVVCHPQSAPVFAAIESVRFCRVLTLDEHGQGSLADAAASQPAEFTTVVRSGSDLAALLYTSGTTGRPKGAMLTHANLASNARVLVDAWGFTADDCLLHALPIFHAHGLFVGLGCAIMSGASMMLLPQFDATAALRWLPECTVMMGVPTYYTRLLATGRLNREICRRMRLFISGSAPLPPEVFRAFRAQTDHDILERYGMTETGMNCSNPLRGERRAGSVGQPLPGVVLRIAGPGDRPLPVGGTGEIQIKGPNVFPGYWGSPHRNAESFTSDGFFRTGDLGWLSDDGYLTIVGRNRDLIITGGLNVYPREVENVIDSLPGVAESAVVGVPHPDFGEAVVAVVVPTTSATEADIRQALRGRLANFKLPKRVLTVRELPRNAMGKVDKATLRRSLAGIFTSA